MSKKKQGSVRVESREVVVADLIPRYAGRTDNPNRMDDERFALLVEAIRAEGFLQPILVTPTADGRFRIEDGHHRWLAAREVGLKSVPAVVLHADPHSSRAVLLGLGMNRLRGELNLSSAAMLISEAQAELALPMPEMSILTGFTADEIETLLGSVGDDVPDLVLDDSATTIERTERAADSEKVYELTIKFTDRDQFKLAKRKLRKLGKGDMAFGVLVALGEDGDE